MAVGKAPCGQGEELSIFYFRFFIFYFGERSTAVSQWKIENKNRKWKIENKK
jgi:hypothetical protein